MKLFICVLLALLVLEEYQCKPCDFFGRGYHNGMRPSRFGTDFFANRRNYWENQHRHRHGFGPRHTYPTHTYPAFSSNGYQSAFITPRPIDYFHHHPQHWDTRHFRTPQGSMHPHRFHGHHGPYGDPFRRQYPYAQKTPHFIQNGSPNAPPNTPIETPVEQNQNEQSEVQKKFFVTPDGIKETPVELADVQ